MRPWRFLLPLVAIVIARAAGDPAPPADGGLMATDAGGEVLGHCPLKHTGIDAEISGTVARVSVTQSFHNPFPEPIEAVYTFPLPHDAAVDEMTLRTGESVVRGVIRKREEAAAVYGEARKAGKVAALLDQQRPNVFTQQVSNLRPGQEVTITIGFTRTVAWEDGRYRFDVPTVVGPRYLPGGGALPPSRDPAPRRGPQGEAPVANPHPAPPTPQVPDADKITPPVAELGFRAGHDVSVTVRIAAGLPITDLKSELHEIVTEQAGGDPTRAVVRLADGAALPDRDFVLSYGTAGDGITDSLLTHTDPRGKFFTLTLEPPDRVEAREILPREILFVLDVSGSMNGFPIDTSKALVSRAIETLRPTDRFNVITFAGGAEKLSPGFLPNTERNRHQALRFIQRQQGEGGTEMMEGIVAALESQPEAGVIRLVCFLTDGYIGNDAEIIAAVKQHAGTARVFCFGIGSSVNRHLLDSMSRAGRGKADYVLTPADARAAAKRFHRRIDAPVLADTAIDFGGLEVTDVLPARIDDLFAAEPVVIRGRYTAAGKGVVRLKGRNAAGPFERELRLDLPEENPANEVLAAQWARAKVGALALAGQTGRGLDPLVRQEIVRLGIDYRLLTEFTSFVGVEEKQVVESGEARLVQVPLEMPQGVSHEGIFGGAGGFGNGWGSGGDGAGGGGGFGNIPAAMQKRCAAEDRMARLKAGGGTPPCDAAVAKALEWMTASQGEDGSWGAEHRCAAAGLALMAYHGRCETVLSEKHGDAVLNAVVFLIDHAKRNQGHFTAVPGTAAGSIEHAVSLAALAEALVFCRQWNVHIPGIVEAVLLAGQRAIISALPTGGWAPPGGKHGDPLITALQLQALKGCKQSGLDFRGMNACVRAALGALDRWHAEARATSAPFPAGAAGFAYSQWDQESEKVPRLLRRQIDRQGGFRWDDPAADLSALCFNAQFLSLHGGEEWERLNAAFLPGLLAAQRPDGSFPAPGPARDAAGTSILHGDGATATHLRTCLATLTLEVYYRYR